MKLSDFSSGVNTRVTPNLIAPNESVVNINVEGFSGSLRSKYTAKTLGVVVAKYFTWFKKMVSFFSINTKTNFVEYQDHLYYLTPIKDTSGIDRGISLEVTGSPQGVSRSYYGIIAPGPLPAGSYSYLLVDSLGPIPGLDASFVDNFIVKFTWVSGEDITCYRVYEGEFRKVGMVIDGTPLQDNVYDIGANELYIPPEPRGAYIYGATHLDTSTGEEGVIGPLSSVDTAGPVTIAMVNPSQYEEVTIVLYRGFEVGLMYKLAQVVLEVTAGKQLFFDVQTDEVVSKNKLYEASGVLVEIDSDGVRNPLIRQAITLTIQTYKQARYVESSRWFHDSGTIPQYAKLNYKLYRKSDMTFIQDVVRVADADGYQTFYTGDLDTPYLVYRSYGGVLKLVEESSVGVSKGEEKQLATDYIYDISSHATFVPQLEGSYSYVATFVIDGEERSLSEPSPARFYSAKVSLSTQYVGQNVVSKFYRVGGNLAYYTLVGSCEAGTVFEDTQTDLAVAGNEQLKDFDSTTRLDLYDLKIYYAMLFAYTNDKLYYSDIGKPTFWGITNFLDFDSEITGYGATQQGLLVFTANSTWIVTGNSHTTFSKYLRSGTLGCINSDSVQTLDGNLIWLSDQGLCASNGGKIDLITQIKLDELGLDLTQEVSSAVAVSQYYLRAGDTTVCLDFRLNANIGYIKDGTELLTATQGKLLSRDEAGVVTELEAGAQRLTYKYKTGQLTEGAITNLKLYKEIYIYSRGDSVCRVYIDGVLSNTITLTGEGVTNTKLKITKGYYIEFEFEGTAEIVEVEYTVAGRQK